MRSSPRLIGLSVGLGVVAIGAFVLVTRAPDPDPIVAAVGPAVPPAAHARPAVPPAPPRDAAIATASAPVAVDAGSPPEVHEALWPVAGSGAMVGMVPPGPYDSLEAVCRSHHAGSDDCKVTEQDVDAGEGGSGSSGPFPQIGKVELSVGSGDDVQLVGGISRMYLAVKSTAGWYAMPFASLMMLNRAGFHATPQPAGDALVLEYRRSEGNRFDNDTEGGITICKPVDGAVSCTPQIPLTQRTDTIDTKPDDWTGHTSIALACVAKYANGAVTVSAMPKPAPNEGDDWDAPAAARCANLPYAGKRRITFRK
jgi:hypothetical protein